jgi:hypothetical protein
MAYKVVFAPTAIARLERLAEVDFDDAWDRQIDADAKAGRLDHLWAEAMEDIKAGRTKPLDEILGNE